MTAATNANLTGNVTSVGNVTTLASIPAISGVNLTDLNASNLASGTVPLARLTGITNTQIDAGAAIADTKLANITTAGKVADSALPGTMSAKTFTADTNFPGSGVWDSSGNVGIGGAPTGGFKLDVKGAFGGTFNGTNNAALKIAYTASAPAGYYATYAP